MNTSDMTRKELRAAAKTAGIKYGKMSLLQIKNALADVKPGAKKKAEPKVRKERTNTKMAQAIAIATKYPDLDRKGLIAKFMSDAKLTKAGASTYLSLVRAKMKTK
jgi:hypothetical protein